MRLRTTLLAGLALSGVFAATPASALNIVLRADSSFLNHPNGAAALLGFQKAANYWNKTITTDATVTLDIHFDALGPNVLASALSNSIDTRVSTVYQQLGATGNSQLDAIAVAHLRPLSAAGGVAYRIPGTDPATGKLTVTQAGSALDDNDSFNNRFLNANTSINKALGIDFDYQDAIFPLYNQLFNLGLREDSDADITFSSDFDFDFDPTDGITNGFYDFIGVAIHEMGHSLGFVSGTDDYEFAVEELVGVDDALTAAQQDQFSWLSSLDLFRYGSLAVLENGEHQLQLDPNRDAFFSIDGKLPFNFNENLAQASSSFFSTGANLGDGNQASHWQDSNAILISPDCFLDARQIGIMDPTSSSCQLGVVTSNDIAAMDAMGWNVNVDIFNNRGYAFNTAQVFALQGLAIVQVPEPATWAMLLSGFGFVGAAMRRRSRVTVTYA